MILQTFKTLLRLKTSLFLWCKTDDKGCVWIPADQLILIYGWIYVQVCCRNKVDRYLQNPLNWLRAWTAEWGFVLFTQLWNNYWRNLRLNATFTTTTRWISSNYRGTALKFICWWLKWSVCNLIKHLWATHVCIYANNTVTMVTCMRTRTFMQGFSQMNKLKTGMCFFSRPIQRILAARVNEVTVIFDFFASKPRSWRFKQEQLTRKI